MPVIRACIRPAALAPAAAAAARRVSARAAASSARWASVVASLTASAVRTVSADSVSFRLVSTAFCLRSWRPVHRAWTASVTEAVNSTAPAPEPQASGVRTEDGAADTAQPHSRPLTAADISRAGAVGRSEGRKFGYLGCLVDE